MKWIKAAKEAAFNNPMNDHPMFAVHSSGEIHHLQSGLVEGSTLEYNGPKDETLLALVDTNAMLIQKVSQLADKIDPPSKSKAPVYDAIMELHKHGVYLQSVDSVQHFSHSGTISMELSFKCTPDSHHVAKQIQVAHHDVSHVNKKGLP